MVTSMTINITIRDLDEKIYRRVKMKAVEEDRTVGEVTNEALSNWLNTFGKKKGKAFLELIEHPVNLGEVTNLTENIDGHVYR